jgi:hypothetical protein
MTAIGPVQVGSFRLEMISESAGYQLLPGSRRRPEHFSGQGILYLYFSHLAIVH